MKNHQLIKFTKKYWNYIVPICVGGFLLYQFGYALGRAAYNLGM